MGDVWVMSAVLVCRVAWMDFYEGVSGDKPRGGGAYVDQEGFGWEIFNFRKESDGAYRGYVRPPGRGDATDPRINVERLGAGPADDAIENVAVFWVAKHPHHGGSFVVGWYDEAKVFREWRPSPRKRALPNGRDAGFMIEARSARLLPTDDRRFEIPRATADVAGMGQSNIWYPPAAWAKKLLDYRHSVTTGIHAAPRGTRKPPPARAAKLLDTEERLRIERVAMEAARDWCEQRELLPVVDVSLQRKGWDLEAGAGKHLLKVEVKGTSQSLEDVAAELTPNEHAMMNLHRETYRLAIVLATRRTPSVIMFAWSKERRAWVGELEGNRLQLQVQPVTSARLKVVPGR
ncbi:MAG: DUF3883 domain-containing protein [Polyangiaceae bacterium]|nr:DUF3883 domain-containing protein [Polyangiaceae bacterium]